MSKETFVFDHDGTWTAPEPTHQAYTDLFETALAQQLQLPRDFLHAQLEKYRQEVLARPQLYGWKNKSGIIVAPASMDTFQLNRQAAELAIAQLRQEDQRLPDEKTVPEILKEIYYDSYPHLGAFYRQDTARMVRELLPLGQIVIVSNAEKESLLEKLEPFLAQNNIPLVRIQVIGEARKHDLDQKWDKVPETAQFSGLTRPVYLRRATYGNILLDLGVAPYILLGDGGELDLSTPRSLGFRTGLITSRFTPWWEKDVFPTFASLDQFTDTVVREHRK